MTDRLSAQDLRAIWTRDILPDLFASCEASDAPELVLLGGQPGAGKTMTGQALAAPAAGRSGLVRIVGDDFRQFHPDYLEVLRQRPLEMPHVTAHAAGEWTRMSVEHALASGFSCLIEGTWRDLSVPQTTVGLAHDAGFSVRAVALGVQPVVSRLATVERYYNAVESGAAARWTPSQGHERALAGITGTAATLGADERVSRVSAVTRTGSAPYDVEDPATAGRGEHFARAIEATWAAPLSPDRARSWLDTAERLHALHREHTADNPDAQAVWAQIAGPDRDQVRDWAARSHLKAVNASFPSPAATLGSGTVEERHARHSPSNTSEKGVER